MRRVLYAVLGVFLLAPISAFAANNPPPCDGCPITTIQGIVDFLVALVSQLQVIFWIVAAGSALYAAFLYIRGGSNAETLKKAQRQILYTVVAIALGLMAYGIPRLVDSFLNLRP